MSTTLTIRNLEAPVKQKLRMQAASHGQSMEAEAREILTRAVAIGAPANGKGRTAKDRMKKRVASLQGIWKGRLSTDEVMRITRGE
jgi:plasmid stability protein